MIHRIKEMLRRFVPLEYRFNKIYRTHKFGGKMSASGPGSDMERTQAVRECLPGLLKELKVKSLLDAPCGDYFWMRTLDLGLEKYIGADIVADLVAGNQKDHGSSRVEFRKLDITKDPLPKVDVIMCRDCLVHLSFRDVHAALQNFKRSGSTYLLTTTFTDHHPNRDIIRGEWGPLNLEAAPFRLPKPLKLINERYLESGGQYRDKCLALWKVADISIA